MFIWWINMVSLWTNGRKYLLLCSTVRFLLPATANMLYTYTILLLLPLLSLPVFLFGKNPLLMNRFYAKLIRYTKKYLNNDCIFWKTYIPDKFQGHTVSSTPTSQVHTPAMLLLITGNSTKVCSSSGIQRQNVHMKFHENLSNSSKVERQDTQIAW